MPQSWITSFYLPPEKAQVLPALVRQFPNLTVFDVGAILQQLQSVLNEVGRAVQLLFLFTLAAGVLVLSAALTATRDERMREAAVLRALGATRRQLARSQRIELWAVGGWPACWPRPAPARSLGLYQPRCSISRLPSASGPGWWGSARVCSAPGPVVRWRCAACCAPRRWSP